MHIDKILKNLNPEQEKAVRTIEGPVLVFAGAGTGKTRVITHRIAFMIYKGINPLNIAAMTFTNKAAQEMRERLFSLISQNDAKNVFLGTFHSYCARLLRKEIELLGWTKDFTIADDSDQLGIMKQAIAELGLKEELNPAECLRFVSSCKSKMQVSEELHFASSFHNKRFVDVYEKYNSILFMQNMLDFDDLLLLTVKIFEKYPEKLSYYSSIHKYLLVDEYQDTNFLQFRLIKMLAGDSMNICVVGDDDQSIYGWRGAEVRNILDFSSHFPGTQVFKLEQNYRSTRTVLNAANSVIAQNQERHPKELWTNAESGDRIVLCAADDEYAEASFIVQEIENIKFKMGKISYDDIAILYRSNYQSRIIEESLKGAQIPYRIIGGHSFYERREVKDAIAYLRLLVNPKDDQSFSRIIASPPRGLGNKALEILRKEKSKSSKGFCELILDSSVFSEFGSKGAKSAAEFGKVIAKWRQEIQNPGKIAKKVELYLKEVGYLDGLLQMYKDREEALKRQENVFELINAIAVFEKTADEENCSLIDFIERYSLNDDSDKVEDNTDMKPAVTLMTVHSAKGLEYKIVFIVGMENGVFPHERSIEERGLDEERRLCYVALTRAKSNLYITYTNFRMKHGELSHQKPSIFLEAIPEELIEEIQYSSQGCFSNRSLKYIKNPYQNQRRFKKPEAFISFDD